MVFAHDGQKPYEFIWFLITAGDAGFLPPPVVESIPTTSDELRRRTLLFSIAVRGLCSYEASAGTATHLVTREHALRCICKLHDQGGHSHTHNDHEYHDYSYLDELKKTLDPNNEMSHMEFVESLRAKDPSYNETVKKQMIKAKW